MLTNLDRAINAALRWQTRAEKAEADRDRLEAQVARLVGALEACVASLERADTEEGVCCCGDSMDRHSDPMSCGHSPVDMGDYYAGKALEAARAVLAEMQADARGECGEWKGPGEAPHRYSPDLMAMGDCCICGHTREAHE